jgi:hypothetical protein
MNEYRKNALSLLFPEVGVSIAASNCVSIDQTTNDNGFLNCARLGFPEASNHGSTAGAVADLLACLGAPTGNASIVGHGNDGIIVTGTGQSANDPDKYISLNNAIHWRPYIRQLRNHLYSFSLWACHPGTGDAGADFLYSIAQTVSCQVAGPTGFLYCDGGRLWLEPKSVWQVATPTNRPTPIPAPTPHFMSYSEIELPAMGSENRFVKLSSVTEVMYVPMLGRNRAPINLRGDEARDLLSLVRFDAPFRPGGTPGALVTGILTVSFGDETREFNIFNGRLLQDRSNPTFFYQATAGFDLMLKSLL